MIRGSALARSTADPLSTISLVSRIRQATARSDLREVQQVAVVETMYLCAKHMVTRRPESRLGFVKDRPYCMTAGSSAGKAERNQRKAENRYAYITCTASRYHSNSVTDVQQLMHGALSKSGRYGLHLHDALSQL